MNQELPTREGFATFKGYNVWYRILGDYDDHGKLPLLCLHGGPGATHDLEIDWVRVMHHGY